ncbi:hypothetical protein Pcinc_014936 [Petrolisthes cinctipes]|uniref:Uncharacterized protein n=1 Tax=Petrolisthes cinctipes TaxID=88211 RepID=A0AAE1FZD4_PETCI|nr:hypothetical protein Pcinc_014936 [Petrolisthes cinctipes]
MTTSYTNLTVQHALHAPHFLSSIRPLNKHTPLVNSTSPYTLLPPSPPPPCNLPHLFNPSSLQQHLQLHRPSLRLPQSHRSTSLPVHGPDMASPITPAHVQYPIQRPHALSD